MSVALAAIAGASPQPRPFAHVPNRSGPTLTVAAPAKTVSTPVLQRYIIWIVWIELSRVLKKIARLTLASQFFGKLGRACPSPLRNSVARASGARIDRWNVATASVTPLTLRPSGPMQALPAPGKFRWFLVLQRYIVCIELSRVLKKSQGSPNFSLFWEVDQVHRSPLSPMPQLGVGE